MSTEDPSRTYFSLPFIDSTGVITASRHADGRAIVRFPNKTESAFHLWLGSADKARELLSAAYEALAILDPDGAPDALIDLVEGDVLAKVRERIAAEDAVMKAVYRDASPPPGLACRDCHTTICPLNADGVCWNRASCDARVAEHVKAGA